MHKARNLPDALQHAATLLEWDLTGQGLDALPDAVPPFPQLQRLRSNEAANLRMAMLLMDGGGVPEAVLPELLAIRCFHPDPEVRALAAERWQPRVSARMREAVARAWQLCELEYNISYDYDTLLERLLLIPNLPAQALVTRAPFFGSFLSCVMEFL